MPIIDSYVDWSFTESRKISVWIMSHSLNYGSAVIESIRIYKEKNNYYTVWLEKYIERFEKWVEQNYWVKTEKKEKIISIMRVLLKLNPDINNPYFRIIFYTWDKSLNTLSNDFHFWIILSDLYVKKNCIKAVFSSRNRENSYLNTLKLASNYSRNIWEMRKALQEGYNYIIFLWSSWEILEGLSENIFILNNGIVYTSETKNIVNGVNRLFLISLFKENGYNVVETDIFPRDINSSSAVIISGSATWIRAINSVWDIQVDSLDFYEKSLKLFEKWLKSNFRLITKLA